MRAMMRGRRDRRDLELVDALLKQLRVDEPTLRLDLVEAARVRLAEGAQPTALELAGTVVAEFA